MNFSGDWHSNTMCPNSTGFWLRPRLSSSVCGSKMLNTRSAAGTFSPSHCARRACSTTRFIAGQKPLQLFGNPRQLDACRTAEPNRKTSAATSTIHVHPRDQLAKGRADLLLTAAFSLLAYRVMNRYSRLVLRSWKRCGQVSGPMARPWRSSRAATRQVSHSSDESVGQWMFVSIAVVSARIVDASIAPRLHRRLSQ